MIDFHSFSDEFINILEKRAGIGQMTNVAEALAKAKGKVRWAPKAPKPIAGPGPSIPGFSPKQTSQMAAANDFSLVGAAARPGHGRI